MPATTANEALPASRGGGRALPVVLLLVALFLFAMAWLQVRDGLAQEAAVPVPNFLLLNIPVPRTVYLEASGVLATADPADGEAWLVRGEAEEKAGRPASEVIFLLRQALIRQPASARARLLLAGQESIAGQPDKAAAALSQAMLLAPEDYYLFAMRAITAARLWPRLDTDTRTRTLMLVREMWQNPILRPQLRMLLADRDGPALVTRAFRGQGDTIRAINLWWLTLPRAVG